MPGEWALGLCDQMTNSTRRTTAAAAQKDFDEEQNQKCIFKFSDSSPLLRLLFPVYASDALYLYPKYLVELAIDHLWLGS